MKKIMGLLVAATALALVGPVLAQPGPGGMGPGGGMGMGSGMGPRLYNPQTVTTVAGQVEKLEELTMGRGGQGMARGHHPLFGLNGLVPLGLGRSGQQDQANTDMKQVPLHGRLLRVTLARFG